MVFHSSCVQRPSFLMNCFQAVEFQIQTLCSHQNLVMLVISIFVFFVFFLREFTHSSVILFFCIIVVVIIVLLFRAVRAADQIRSSRSGVI